jgi:hypothetical protein
MHNATQFSSSLARQHNIKAELLTAEYKKQNANAFQFLVGNLRSSEVEQTA